MAEEIVTPKPLSHNEMGQLAEILEHNFQYHYQQQTLFRQDCIPHLKTAVGLGFTAIMVDNLFISMHQPDLHLFLKYFNTQDEPNSIAPIALAAVKIIDTGAHLFRRQYPCPAYYNTFAEALKKVVQSSPLDSTEKNKQSQRFLQLLLRNNLF